MCEEVDLFVVLSAATEVKKTLVGGNRFKYVEISSC